MYHFEGTKHSENGKSTMETRFLKDFSQFDECGNKKRKEK